MPDSRFKIGRQRINLDNQRFVGGVGWRQNEQTYDAVSLVNTSLTNTTISYAYVDNVNRIFGGEVAAGDHDSSTHLLNVKRQFEQLGSLSGYYYRIDNKDAAAFSTDTVGLRFAGKSSVLGKPLSYTLEYAKQRDAANNPVDYDADYLRLDADLAFQPLTAIISYEVLSGDRTQAGAAFRTPLATLHAFQGWADQFLATPAAGLEDIFVGAKGKFGRFSWRGIWHDFSAEEGSTDFGSEIDLRVAADFGPHYRVQLKLADFNADSAAFRDTKKTWLVLSLKY